MSGEDSHHQATEDFMNQDFMFGVLPEGTCAESRTYKDSHSQPRMNEAVDVLHI
jgi:hypothetical protein